MKVRKVLELSVDVQDIFRETPLVIRAMLETVPAREGQLALLQAIRTDVDSLLKGAEANGKPLREPGRIEKDQ